jgi:hypothetical protein
MPARDALSRAGLRPVHVDNFAAFRQGGAALALNVAITRGIIASCDKEGSTKNAFFQHTV